MRRTLAILALTSLCAAWTPTDQDLEDMSRRERAEQLALATVAVNEAGLQSESDDVAMILEVFENRRGRGSLLRIMRAYSGKAFDRRRSDCRRWIPFLNLEADKPKHWDEERSECLTRPGWAWGRPRWKRIVERAGRLIVTPPAYRPEVCNGRVDDWGGEMDTDEYLQANPNAVRLRCPNTENIGWCLPRLGRCPASAVVACASTSCQ